MKYSGLRNQLAALRAQLPQAGLRIVIEGGLPDGTAAAASPEPQQLELPLPKPPPSPNRALGRVFAILTTPPAAKIDPEAPQGVSEPDKALDWQTTWWHDQHRRRERG